MELLEFFLDIQKSVADEISARVELPGETFPFSSLVFTEIVCKHMAECGMTHDQPEISNFDAKVGKSNGRLTGFSISEDLDQIDLFVTVFCDTTEIVNIPDSVTTKAAEQCLRFLAGCVDGTLAKTMDASHEAYGLVETIQACYDNIDQIRIYVLTNGKVKTRNFQSRNVSGKTVKLEVMDIQRLFNHIQEGKPRDELEINFNDIAGAALPCIWVPDEMGEYDYAMTALPGETLRFIYDKFGPRVLEANVRSFLSQTGKVNKGIAATLRDQPERFMAYNNGIVVVADDIRLGEAPNGGPGIAWLKGMQIVNGGQTTASMFFTKRKFPATDLSKVRVPAKIIVLRETDSAKEEALISDISRYANSQNKVNESDLSANRPFHVEMESLALSIYCPDGVSRWFYERAAGSYKVMLEREGRTPAGIRNLKSTIPPSRKITKTELAKYLCAWSQRPDLVSMGGQKNFVAFMSMIDQEQFADFRELNASKFKQIIARTIAFRDAEKRIRKAHTAFQANITAYTISYCAKIVGDRINFDLIWNNQAVSAEFSSQIEAWSHQIAEILNKSAKGRMVSEWAKKQECWESVKSADLRLNTPQVPELA